MEWDTGVRRSTARLMRAGGLANTRVVCVGSGKLICVYEGTVQKDRQTTLFAERSYLLNINLNFVG